MRKRLGIGLVFLVFGVLVLSLSVFASASQSTEYVPCEPIGACMPISQELDDMCSCNQFKHRAPNEKIDCPWVALEMLMEGNWRFVTNELMPRDTNLTDRWINATGQWPFAAIVTCADSRVSPELYFDQKAGDLFVVRNAGNIADSTALGSLEFAVEFLGAPLVVVVGHTECGAVINAHAGAQGLADNLQGVLDHVNTNIADSACADSAKVDNVHSVVEQIRANPVIERTGAVVVGAIFDIASGRIIILDDAACCVSLGSDFVSSL